MMQLARKSDKLCLIDRGTYSQLRQDDTNSNTQKLIRNSKYKKAHRNAQYSLLDFVKVKNVKKSLKNKKLGLAINTLYRFKKRGKIREGVACKKKSRLKKSILCYRQKKLLQERDEKQDEALNASMQKLTIHSRRFRDYCDNCTTDGLTELTEELLRKLDHFQKRAYQRNEIKARAHKRFVLGFREVQSYLLADKIKLVIIATDCERCDERDGLDETITNIKMKCQKQQIPYVFAFARRKLSYVLFKKTLVSCAGILDYDGANDTFHQLLTALAEARQKYKQICENK